MFEQVYSYAPVTYVVRPKGVFDGRERSDEGEVRS